jgi:hypothetical protein
LLNTRQDLEEETQRLIKFYNQKFVEKKTGNITQKYIRSSSASRKPTIAKGRHKLYEIMKLFGIQNKLKRVIQATIENSTYCDKTGSMMTDSLEVGNGLKQED